MSSKIGTTTNFGKFLEEWTLQENSDGGAAINLVATSQTQLTKAETGVTKVYTAFGITPSPTFNTNTAFVPVQAFAIGAQESEQYYFHPDHLGSSNYITNIAGDVSQHMEYFAFGETFVEEHKNSINSPYKFNGKELDEESGLYYYGARYYDPRLSIWASVDPLANFNPFMDDEFYFDGMHNSGVYNTFNHSVYSYCYQNPIKLIDPNGKQVESEILGSWSTDSSFANGMIDGLIDNIPGWGAIKEIGKLTTDPKYRAQLVDMIQAIAENPVAFLEKVAKDKLETYKAFFEGTATDQQNYDVGVDLGGILPGLIGGGIALKLLKDLKNSGVKSALKELCFVVGTLVLTSNGLKKIEEIQVGNKVWSFDEQTGELELREVVSLSQNTSSELIEVTIGNEKIVCTPEHPFYVANNWVEAKDLKVGYKLALKNGTLVEISDLKQVDKTEKVYNFEVAENHNYYVTELGVLVHNNCWATFKGALSKHSTHKSGGVYQVNTKNAPFNMKKGDYYYIDKASVDGGHGGTHIELFDKNGKSKGVLNTDGTINELKSKAAKGRTLDVKKL